MQFSSKDVAYRSQAPISTMKKPPELQKSGTLQLSAEELIERYAAGERDFRGIDLNNQVLEGVNLTGANLRRAKLHGIQLKGANLTGIKLRKADLRQVDLTGANLCGADLSGASLHQVNLQDANLRGVDLSDANLSETSLSGADLGGAILPDGSILLTSKLSSRLCLSKNKGQSPWWGENKTNSLYSRSQAEPGNESLKALPPDNRERCKAPNEVSSDHSNSSLRLVTNNTDERGDEPGIVSS